MSVNTPGHAALLRDMRRALQAEFGARAFYRLMARKRDDDELAGVLLSFVDDESVQIERLRELMLGLGARAPSRSMRRALLARLLYMCTWIGARRMALRLCYESECAVLRWYRGYAEYLLRADLAGAASACESLAFTKQRHAQILETWVAR